MLKPLRQTCFHTVNLLLSRAYPVTPPLKSPGCAPGFDGLVSVALSFRGLKRVSTFSHILSDIWLSFTVPFRQKRVSMLILMLVLRF